MENVPTDFLRLNLGEFSTITFYRYFFISYVHDKIQSICNKMHKKQQNMRNEMPEIGKISRKAKMLSEICT